MDRKNRPTGVNTPIPTALSSEHPPGLTSASSSPPSSQDEEVTEDLDELRRQNEEKLQGRFQSIYAKYGRDFAEVSDEIDLVTGEVTVSNGHLKYMRHERDVGPPSLFHNSPDRDLSNDQHESPTDNSASQNSIASLINTNPASWSKPGAFDQYFSHVSKDRVVELVQNAVEGQEEDVNSSDSSFVQAFSQKIAEQVAHLMQTLKSSEVEDLKAILPSVLEQQLLAQNSTSADQKDNSNKILRSPAKAKQAVEVEPKKWEPSIWEDAEFTFTSSRSNSPLDADGNEASTRRTAASRSGIARWTKEEDEWLVALKSSGSLTYREISRRVPNRSYRAVRQRFRTLVDRDPTILSTSGDLDLDLSLGPEPKDSTPEPRKPVSVPTTDDSEQTQIDHTHYSSKRVWTPADDELLLKLREQDKMTWAEAAHYFPGRSADAVSWRYYFRLQKGAKNPIKRAPKPDGAASETSAEHHPIAETGEACGEQVSAPATDLSTSEMMPLRDSIQSATSNDIEMGKTHALSPSEDFVGASNTEYRASDVSAPELHTIEDNVDQPSEGQSKKRKRSPDARDNESNKEDIPQADYPSLIPDNIAAIPIDPMLLHSHINEQTSTLVPQQSPSEAQEGLPYDLLMEAPECDPEDDTQLPELLSSPALPQQQSTTTLSPNKTPSQAKTAWHIRTPSSITTPTRKSRWSLSDTVALMKRMNTTPHIPLRMNRASMMHDLNDGLGSEDELA